MADDTPVNRMIFLIDDDAAVCHALSVFLEVSGFNVMTFPCAEAFLEMEEGAVEGVILLDQRMEGMTGLELQAELIRRGITLPIIFITGYMDEQIYAEAIKAGAINFLQKPFSNEDLLESIGVAFSKAENSTYRIAKKP
jgi:FixJ family two-component response regulator